MHVAILACVSWVYILAVRPGHVHDQVHQICGVLLLNVLAAGCQVAWVVLKLGVSYDLLELLMLVSACLDPFRKFVRDCILVSFSRSWCGLHLSTLVHKNWVIWGGWKLSKLEPSVEYTMHELLSHLESLNFSRRAERIQTDKFASFL